MLWRCGDVSQEELDFASFYEASRDDCLRTVLASVGDMDTAQDMVAEAFARAWASWRKVSRHPAPRAWVVRTALNVGVSSWRKRRRDQPLLDDGAAAVGGLRKGCILCKLGLPASMIVQGIPPVLRYAVAVQTLTAMRASSRQRRGAPPELDPD